MPLSSKPKRTRAGKSKSGSTAVGDGGIEAPFDLGTDKLYFKIGEVAEIVDVAAHVLRYWESEFAIIKPQKSRSQQRVYRRKDVENLLRIKHLLYDRKFTIAGARQELRKGAGKIEPAPVSGIYRAKQSLARVREQLDLLAAAVRADPEPAHLASDPAAFMRSIGGARGVLEAEAGSPSILDRPERGRDG
ncbi:MAG TPA: MerR family transcriptional regulator [Enhygromyxa sp.]|nr:MerR family transcriptional regulator [Enhygromyxa sp.]